MKNNNFLLFIPTFLLFLSFNGFARENVGQNKKSPSSSNFKTLASGCTPATAQTDLDINNVRTTILAGGDMWWDLLTAKYEIPKGSKKHSLFSGALWIGGIDIGGQLKVAAMTYRQGGSDFWPGPLDTTATSVDLETCNAYDKHFKITRKEVDDYYGWMQNPKDYPGYVIPNSILNWPAHGDPAKKQTHYLAPFHDGNGDGQYTPDDPSAGDYPDYNVLGETGCTSQLYGDQTLWWVFNDQGNIHTETNAQSIGLEIHAQAFAFATNDEINNMTFYNYKIINRSSFAMTKTYFGQWVDADLGKFDDDYVGCDVQRGLGYCYNGNNATDGIDMIGQYGPNPPAIGVDFFRGPLADAGDGIDNDRDSTIDETGEQIIMSKFVYYNNDFTQQGNPENATHFYNYLSGLWKNGIPFTYGGDAYNEPGPVCDFMFPGDSDPTGWGTGGLPQAKWDEASVGNKAADRRFLQSAGPFTLLPGAVNTITTGVVWARTTQGGAMVSVELMKAADDKAQALFDNCFQVLNGPDAPDLTIQELKNELLFYISNKPTSNNYLEKYSEFDPLIGSGDSTYDFEGYQIFQLKDVTVSVTDIHNPDKARLVTQCDVKNGITQLVNFEFDPALKANVAKEEVNGGDKGIIHSFKITDDQFASGVKTLVNHKSYYYMALSYGYNNYKTYNQNDPMSLDGQKQSYKAGRRNVKVYTVIPHNPSPEANGTEQRSDYGDGPQLMRIEGQGNGGNILELTDATVSQILADGRAINPVYKNGKGPIQVKVIDPLNVPSGNFEIKIGGVTGSAKWTLTNITTGKTISSDKTISIANEQLIPEWGLSVTIQQIPSPGDLGIDRNGFLEASMTFADDTKRWLTGLADGDGENNRNWIRSGKYASETGAFNDVGHSMVSGKPTEGIGLDDNQEYEKVLGGTWAPFRLCAYSDEKFFSVAGPAINVFDLPKAKYMLNNLASVDIVITSDKSKWTRCPVVELQEETVLAEGGAKKLDLRKGASVDKNGLNSTQPGYNAAEGDLNGATGMGWFPGYAINLETGERLNMAFGEDSWLANENGRDMQWNPTSNVTAKTGQTLYGGKHYIYVFGHNGSVPNKDVPSYDEGTFIRTQLGTLSELVKKNIYEDAMWVNIPLLTYGHNILETDVKIKLRVAKPYKRAYSATWGANISFPSVDSAATSLNTNYPMYSFNTNDIATQTNNVEAAKTALDLINVVPNPYYAYSSYEKTSLDNTIKITNLPEKCTVTIYTINGTRIRTFNKDEKTTSYDWDLKNQAGIPIASGLYIIHIEAEGIGEKTIKWFGVLRPIDLDSF